MKNHLKMTLFAGLFILSILAISNHASAYTYTPASSSYTEVSNTVEYSERIVGENRGFSLRYSSTVPRDQVISGCDYYDWTSNYRKCGRTSKYNDDYYQDDYSYSMYDRYHYDNFRAPINLDQGSKEAFKTFQQSSKQQSQLELKKLDMISQRYQRNYGGYSSGYSRYRFSW